MKQQLRDTLLRKLGRLTTLAVLIAMLVTLLAVGFYEETTFLPRVVEQARGQAAVAAEIVVPALEFDDERTATRLLQVLRHEETVVVAGVYRADGSLLAEYRSSPAHPAPPAAPLGYTSRIDDRTIEVISEVTSADGIVGRVWLQARVPDRMDRARQYFPLLLAVAFSVVVLSLFIAYATHRQITAPVRTLVETVQRIGESRDLSLRVPEGDRSELGQLAHSFNAMLTAINAGDRRMLERDARLVRQNTGLTQLARRELADEAGFDGELHEFTELVAEGQETARVSVWLFDESGGAIICADLYEREHRRHTAGGRLARADFPVYFQALDLGETINAADALTDPRTREFADSYLHPHGIGALLDAPIRWRGRLVGVLCHEHIGGCREWHADEAALANIVAERIAHLLERRETLRVDAALHESDARFRDFISQAQDAIFTLSLDGRIQSVNDTARRITGWDMNTWLGHRFQRILLPEDVPLAERKFAAVIAGGSPASFELQIRTRTGGIVTLEFAVSPQRKGNQIVGLLGIGRDVTERNQAAGARLKLEEQLRHSQKMEAIGTMAGGIAHDFNNILTAIIGNAQLAEFDTASTHPARQYLEQTIIASHRAKELVQQILAFSRRQEQKLGPVSLAQVVKESLKLLRPVIPSTIRIESRLPENLPPVLADATQLQQVVVNLATNAAHAMEEQGGRLELTLDEIEVDLEMVALDPKLKPGRFVKFAVTDTGIGMSPAVLQKIFDPFFTTKQKDKGTGLGLAVVHGIVQQHGGVISVYSTEGAGTTFTLYLPVAEAAPAVPRPPAPAAAKPGVGQAILVVDDEAQVLEVTSAVLRRHGYRPVAYQDPRQALAAFRECPAGWQLIITDQLMPDMKGTMLAAEIWKIRPGIPIILASGFAGNLDETAIGRGGFAGLLQKPFTRDMLLSLVGQMLARPAG